MKAIIIIILTFLICSCGARKIDLSEKTTVTDSTFTTVRTVKRDTIITVPGDSIKVRIPIYDIQEVPITRKTERASVTISKENDTLIVDCKCEQYQELIRVQDKIIEKQRELITNLQKTVVIPEKYTPWYVKVLAWIGGISILIVAAALLIKYIKP
jgi:hypothetical protein